MVPGHDILDRPGLWAPGHHGKQGSAASAESCSRPACCSLPAMEQHVFDHHFHRARSARITAGRPMQAGLGPCRNWVPGLRLQKCLASRSRAPRAIPMPSSSGDRTEGGHPQAGVPGSRRSSRCSEDADRVPRSHGAQVPRTAQMRAPAAVAIAHMDQIPFPHPLERVALQGAAISVPAGSAWVTPIRWCPAVLM